MGKGRVPVAIIGAGPAGLSLAHLLSEAGIESVVLENRSRRYIENRTRAGLLEHRTVEFLEEHGLGARMRQQAMVHGGTELRFDGERHRISYAELCGGKQMLVYPQQELVADLVRLRLESGNPIVFEVDDVKLSGFDGESPSVTFSANGATERIDCDFIAGCDGFHGVSRPAIPEGVLRVYDNRMPFGWLGIIAAVPPSTEEIIYALNERGFAGHMLRTSEVSRFYLQCDPDEDIANWPDDRIWYELRTRLATADGWTLREGPVLEKSITEMRSFVVEPMQFGRLFLAGDAAHIVPPTGAKGMNLAISDARVLAAALAAHFNNSDDSELAGYSAACLRRVWRVQEFSTWMSWMLHRLPGEGAEAAFQHRLQLAQLRYVCSSKAAMTSFAENYVGLDDVGGPVGAGPS